MLAYVFVSVVKYFHVAMVSDIRSNQDQLSTINTDGIIPLMFVMSIYVANVLLVNVSYNSAYFGQQIYTQKVFISDATAELVQVSQQLLYSKLQFTAWEVFNVSFTFLYGFVGGVGTYTVIVLQFQ